ncbi:TipC family immunity protein [Aciduricibacillus chroicocephali]|uniref:TipC family immunity protein n=1 Tax=Aciduricibacillus chroicocephali TaxID=3054939 RepID=A0ABY9KXB5_9BACI|nr:TipC family immunity protein [Bacillaceae bacterium 44XB]
MKNKRDFMVRFSLLFVLLGWIFINNINLLPKNVFEEMYQIEAETIKKQKHIGFARMDNLVRNSRDNVNYVENMFSEVYKTPVFKKGDHLGFLFLFDDRQLNITYSQKLAYNIFFNICYEYTFTNKSLREYVLINDENLDEFTVSSPSAIKTYLKEYKISEAELKQISQKVLYERVLPDWFDAYDSKFTIEDLGDVKIEKDSFLK